MENLLEKEKKIIEIENIKIKAWKRREKYPKILWLLKKKGKKYLPEKRKKTDWKYMIYLNK